MNRRRKTVRPFTSLYRNNTMRALVCPVMQHGGEQNHCLKPEAYNLILNVKYYDTTKLIL